MKRFSIPPREERERHSHTMSAYDIFDIFSSSLNFQLTDWHKDNKLSDFIRSLFKKLARFPATLIGIFFFHTKMNQAYG